MKFFMQLYDAYFDLEDNLIPLVVFLHLVGVRSRLSFCHDATSGMSSILSLPMLSNHANTECVPSACLYRVLGIVELYSRSLVFPLRKE